VLKKRIYQNVYEQFNKTNKATGALGTVPSKEERSGLHSKVVKVWSQLSRAVANQMDRGSVVDTLYYGSFAKASTVKESPGLEYYVYCPGPKAAFKLVENDENIADLL
jgi:hypothetical protein